MQYKVNQIRGFLGSQQYTVVVLHTLVNTVLHDWSVRTSLLVFCQTVRNRDIGSPATWFNCIQN